MPKKTRLTSDKNDEMIIHNIKFPRLNDMKPRWWKPSFFYCMFFLACITLFFHCVLLLLLSIVGQ